MKLKDLLIPSKFNAVKHPNLGIFTIHYNDYNEFIISFNNHIHKQKYLFDNDWDYIDRGKTV